MSRKLQFVFPMPDNATNAGGRSRNFWTIAHRRKKYLARLDELQNAGVLAPPPESPLTKASARSVMYLGAAMDDDNALARHKAVLDWLKTRGYLADDRKKNLRWESLPDQIIKRDGNYRIEMTLTEEAA